MTKFMMHFLIKNAREYDFMYMDRYAAVIVLMVFLTVTKCQIIL